MADLDIHKLRADIKSRGLKWDAIELPQDFKPRGLGWNPAPPEISRAALETAQRLMVTRMPHLFRQPMNLRAIPVLRGVTAPTPMNLEAALPPQAGPAAGPSHPNSFDWRTRGVIGPVTDQRWCGSCVSFATTGTVGAMAGVEYNGPSVHLSEADQHFCSSHGADCEGWNNGDALNQIKSRGTIAAPDFPYMTAFDNPPIGDPNDIPDHLWIAHCRSVADRDRKIYRVTEVAAWTGDDRKTYLANIGPLTCGFTVYQDFDHYGGGVYKHISGDVRGGHAVMVIGYSDDEQCWICRNSWGTNFGGSARPDGTGGGFFKIGYGECDIDNEAFFGALGVIAPASSWWHGLWTVAGGAAAPGTSVFGVSRSADHLDIFAVGTDHGTYTAAWEPSLTAWQGWWHVQGGFVAPNTSITAVSRSANKLDIFCVGTNHSIYTAAWQAGDTSWRGWWTVAGGVAAPGTSVFGVSRSADHLDIFAVGTDMQVYTAAWQAGDMAWRGWWPIGHFKAAPGTSVHAVSRSTDKLDIFAVGEDGGIYTAAWQAGDTAWRGWWRILGGIAAPNTMVTAVVRSPDHLDIFAVGKDHQIYTAAWQP